MQLETTSTPRALRASAGLTVDRVDFLRRTVRIDRQLITPTTRGVAASFGPPKTPKSDRVLPLPEVVGRVADQRDSAGHKAPANFWFENVERLLPPGL
jgi:hypothetical protein